jgi:hypothetical protein
MVNRASRPIEALMTPLPITSMKARQKLHGFIDSLEQAYTHISRHPATGSPRYAHELNLPGLRYWPLTRYPNPVFYVEDPDHIDADCGLLIRPDLSATHV